MTKRKKLGFALIAILIMATSAFLYLHAPDKPIRINGNLAPEDLADVQSIVRREIWRGTFPDWSFKTFRNLPGAIKTRLNRRVVSIDVFYGEDWPPQPTLVSGDSWLIQNALVNVSGKTYDGALYTYSCTRISNQWAIVSRDIRYGW
ncbi:hypothetical protein [Pedosphaera parvula]|uniref:Uncharacterized protein n=1 Tax=Pedosphaera parvula (strain Ellin514) TaxID=320771 RepID=B9XED9_PEDPL|nr:hypothetical protein [Pedosphaera parvula]EEF61653.1 hypothetical protein Cflav_PD4693 [Pedosphaera parvula Ellin514]